MYRLSSSIYYEDQGEGTIIVDVSRGKFFELNPVSCEIIKLVAQNKEEQEIAETLSLKYNADVNRVLSDVKTFMEKLTQMGIVETY